MSELVYRVTHPSQLLPSPDLAIDGSHLIYIIAAAPRFWHPFVYCTKFSFFIGLENDPLRWYGTALGHNRAPD